MGEHRTALTVAVITGLFGVLAAVITVVLPQMLEDDDEPRNPPAAQLAPTSTFTAPAVLTDPTPTSTLPPLQVTPGTVLYEANAELGWSGWSAASWHVLSDRLSNDSLSEGVWISAPYQPDRIADNAVEAEIRLSKREENCDGVMGEVRIVSESAASPAGSVRRSSRVEKSWPRDWSTISPCCQTSIGTPTGSRSRASSVAC
jgi:hypothetical protein